MANNWLMRHGIYEGHRPGHHAPRNAPLSPQGRNQVLQSLPLPEGIAAIVTSPVLRACQTAAVLAQHTRLPIVAVTDLLAEWHAPSSILGRTPDNYPAGYRTWRRQRLVNPDLPFEDGESLTDLHTRAGRCAAFLHCTAQRHGPLLAVSHTVLLGVLTHLSEGPSAFTTAVNTPWHFAERRPIDRTLPLPSINQ